MCDPDACERTCVPRIDPATDPRATFLCVCDPAADQIAALMAEHDVDQWTASGMLWPECRRSA